MATKTEVMKELTDANATHVRVFEIPDLPGWIVGQWVMHEDEPGTTMMAIGFWTPKGIKIMESWSDLKTWAQRGWPLTD